jgi:hypothetical protein
MVKWNPGNVVVQNVGLYSTVEEEAADPAKVAVNGRCGAAQESPGIRPVIG